MGNSVNVSNSFTPIKAASNQSTSSANFNKDKDNDNYEYYEYEYGETYKALAINTKNMNMFIMTTLVRNRLICSKRED